MTPMFSSCLLCFLLARCELFGSIPESLPSFGTVNAVQPDLDLLVAVSQDSDAISVGYADDTGCYEVIEEGY